MNGNTGGGSVHMRQTRNRPVRAAQHKLAFVLRGVRLASDVEYRAILVLSRWGQFAVPVSHEAFRRNNTFNDAVGCTRAVAADTEHALTAVVVFNQRRVWNVKRTEKNLLRVT